MILLVTAVKNYLTDLSFFGRGRYLLTHPSSFCGQVTFWSIFSGRCYINQCLTRLIVNYLGQDISVTDVDTQPRPLSRFFNSCSDSARPAGCCDFLMFQSIHNLCRSLFTTFTAFADNSLIDKLNTFTFVGLGLL